MPAASTFAPPAPAETSMPPAPGPPGPPDGVNEPPPPPSPASEQDIFSEKKFTTSPIQPNLESLPHGHSYPPFTSPEHAELPDD